MADHIRVDTEQMEEIRSKLMELASELSSLSSQISRVDIDRESGSEVKMQLSAPYFPYVGRSANGRRALECMESLARMAREIGTQTRSLAGAVGVAADEMERTEREIQWLFEGQDRGESSLFKAICSALGIGTDISGWAQGAYEKLKDLVQAGKVIVEDGLALIIGDDGCSLVGIAGSLGLMTGTGSMWKIDSDGTMSLTLGDTTIKYSASAGALDASQSLVIESKDGRYTYENGFTLDFGASGKKKIDGGEIFKDKDVVDIPVKEGAKKDETEYQEVTLLSVGVSAGATKNLWYDEVSFENGNLSGGMSMGIGNVSTNASVTGGFGVLVPDENGELKFNAGVKAEVGFSVSAVEVDGSLKYELIDGVDIEAEGNMKLLSGEVSAGAGIGIIDGELNAYVEAGAEYNIAEAEGSVGVNIAGIKGSVGGSVSVGFGATAKAGYKDGIVSFEVGAAIGVGASVNFEVDVSGAVETFNDAVDSAADFAEDVGDAVKSGYKTVCGWFKKW